MSLKRDFEQVLRQVCSGKQLHEMAIPDTLYPIGGKLYVKQIQEAVAADHGTEGGCGRYLSVGDL